MNFKEFFESKTFKVITWTVAGLIVLLLAFWVGVAVGYKKAMFSYSWGENYHRNFGGPRGGFVSFSGEDENRDFINPHGAFGQIVKIEGNNFFVSGQDNAEKVVVVSGGTKILRFRDEIKPSDLKIDDYVVVIGQPNEQGQIEAKIIRVMPAPPKFDKSASSGAMMFPPPQPQREENFREWF